jgi:hypothetical protein
MPCCHFGRTVWTLLGCLSFAAAAGAQEVGLIYVDSPGPYAGDSVAQRSHPGQLFDIAWYARPSDTGHYIGYYVGGGCVWKGDARSPSEGTWGWDYQGILFPRRVVLGWCRSRYQGGVGYYRTVPKPNLKSPSTP